MNTPSASTRRSIILVILLLGVALRFVGVDRPFDNRLVSPWRESDYFSIARNFHREGMNIAYPRIDWREDTPGFVEMELPVIPFTTAALYDVFGEKPQLQRALCGLLETGSLLIFALLASTLLTWPGLPVALLAFALNPTLVELASSMQPEPLLNFCLMVAMFFTYRYQRSQGFSDLYLACVATACALLAKATGAYMGFVLAFVVLKKLGSKAFFSPHVYLAAAVALTPALAWYGWAHSLYTTWGLSIGLSNEAHFIGPDMLWPPAFVAGILKLETSKVFTPLGWLLAGAALFRRPRPTLALVWYGAILLYYVTVARTAADGWAYYYHSISVAPACLLMGYGINALVKGDGPFARLASPLRRGLALASAAGLGLSLALLGARAAQEHQRRWQGDLLNLYTCALSFQGSIPPDSLIVVAGGTMVDAGGHPVAYNRPMAFAWLDRKGFNYGREERSIQSLEAIAARGGRYWIVQSGELEDPALAGVEARFAKLMTCDNSHVLFDLKAPPAPAPSGGER